MRKLFFLLNIVWNPDLVAFRLGPLSVRWYGLMWTIGIALAHLVEDEEEDISQLSTFVSETFRTFAPKVTTD